MINKKIWVSIGLILAALGLRLTQVFTLIEFKTGFYKRDNSNLGSIITIFVFALCVAAATVSLRSLHIKKRVELKIMPVVSLLAAVALLYELVAEKFALQGIAWQVVLMKAFGFSAAIYFGLFAASRLFKFKMPDILHVIPAIYMIMRIICSFINISSLSLIAENIFFIAALCCNLLFFVSYAAFYCLDDHDKTLNFRAVLAGSVCGVTAISNIIANICVKGGYTHIPLYSQLVLLMLTLFIAVFTFNGIFEKKE